MSLFEVLSQIEDIDIIAVGSKIRDLQWLQKKYGRGLWRKLKGFARIRFLDDGEEFEAELHWYEAHSIGKVEMKIKELFD
jgi:hypothetical protein